ncbi:autotransporter outer membrane beta-barrel domain-containing protein [Bradyrhizobium sp. CCBAU 65884]|uniref:autotransporter outer membrane beta-barrel domain-containing protein n=1 Tax=Bradyrhizobium sp. CCBAU 65884 TaxID=722477 RepID=UPI0023063EDB|nr:autotransporter domain-containing protein [Bradyrhizobium sp. CCBAU 65884]
MTTIAISGQAAAQTWNGGPGQWNAGSSWTPGTVPNAVDAVAMFNFVTANVTYSLDLTGGPFTIGTLNLNATVANGNFGFNSGTLIMQTSAGSAAINVQSNPHPILPGDITPGATLELASNTVITTASATAEFRVDNGGLVTGPGSLTVAGPGAVALNSANTYAGGTTVTGGTLTGGHATAGAIDAFGAGAITMSGGTLRTTATGTLANDITFTAATSSTLSAAAGTTLLAAGGMNVAAAHVQFGSATDTGTVQLQLAVGTSVSIFTTLAVNGGTLQATDTVLSFLTGNAGSTTVAAGAVLDYNDQTSVIRNLLGAGTVNTGSNAATNITIIDGNFGGVIQGAGRLSLSFGVSGTVTLTGANTYTGGTAINAGHTLQLGNGGTTGSIVGNVVNNGTLAINRSNLLTFGGVISGSGALQKSGGGLTWLTATNSYTGATTVDGGLLFVDGSIASSVLTTVTANGALGGNGTVGATQINTGGGLTPGSATPGTSLTLASLAMQSGAQYFVYANPTTSTFANVTGNAAIGGASVVATFAAGSYVAKQYTILTAGSITGAFDPTISNHGLPAGFHTSLSYDATATHAYLNLTLDFVPPSGNLNGNQQNVGNAIINYFNSNGTIPMVFGSLTPAGLTQLSGEVGSAPQQATFNAMNQFMGVMTDPFIAGRGDPVGAGGTPNAYTDETALAYARKRKPNDALAAIYTKAPIAAAFEQRWSVWAAGFGGAQQTDGRTVVGSNTTTSNLYGTAVGADYRISRDTLVGFALAGGGTNFTVANALGGGRADLFQAGAFFRHIIGPAYITGALAYGWQDITTDRTVTVAGVDRLRAEFNANTYSGRLEGGYRFVTQGVGLTPYAAAQFTTFDLPAYAEQVIVGSNQFALAYGAKSITDTRSELGLRTDKSFAQADGIVTLRGRLAWAHDFNPDRVIGATFQSLPGASFVVNGAAMAPDSALVTGSVEKKWLNGWSAAGTFEGEFSSVTRSYAGKGVVRYAW